MKKSIKPSVVSESFIKTVNSGNSNDSEAGNKEKDVYGRDVSKWISVEGKLRPHP